MSTSYSNHAEKSTKSRPKRQREQRDRESETQSSTGNGDSQDTQDSDEKPRLFVCVGTLQEAAQIALDDKSPGDPVFKFARAVRAFELTMDFRLPAKELPVAFGVWWTLAKPTLPPDTDRDECFILFEDAYHRARTPLGANVIRNAIARLATTGPPPEAEKFDSPKIKRLVHFCHELQLLCGNSPFFLSVRDAARVIDCPKYETASAFLRGLVRGGVLEPVEWGKPGGHRASRFRYVRLKPPG